MSETVPCLENDAECARLCRLRYRGVQGARGDSEERASKGRLRASLIARVWLRAPGSSDHLLGIHDVLSVFEQFQNRCGRTLQVYIWRWQSISKPVLDITLELA